jgi:hypothetical protein
MRLSRKVLVIIGFIVIGIVLGLMVSNYFETAAEHTALQDRLALAQTRIPSLTSQKAELENDERQARSRLDTGRAKFPQAVESIEYGDDLFDLAVKSNVRIARLNASPPANREVGGITYSVSSFSLTISGEVKDMLGFVDALRAARDFQLPWGAEVKTVNISYSGRQATISIDIYAYKG